MGVSEASLELAAEVSVECERLGCEVLLIGALALAAHGYPRGTEDVDFAIALPPRELANLARELAKPDLEVTLSESDADDPLGGVVTLRRAGALPVQLVNFDNSPAGGFPRLVHDALKRATKPEGGAAKLVTAEDLILFKLYAGGPKSTLDIIELLTRAPVDVGKLQQLAEDYGLSSELSRVLALAGLP